MSYLLSNNGVFATALVTEATKLHSWNVESDGEKNEC